LNLSKNIKMNSLSNKKDLGDWGENIAAEFLKKQGYLVIDRKFSCPYGEIDLIAREGPIWCFVEVKTRNSSSFGYGYQGVTRLKQKHIIKVAQYYLNQAALYDAPARFDIVSIDLVSTADYKISLIRNAFYMS
jgi:putative endonuclease